MGTTSLIRISDRYLWFPVGRTEDKVRLHLFVEEKKIQECEIRIAENQPDFYFAMDMNDYLGREIMIRSDTEDVLPETVSCHSEMPALDYPFLPEVHFTAESGWMNDPNGLVFADGIYET